jgi:hypothetical protein
VTSDSPWFVVHQRDGDLFVEAFTGEGAKHAARMTARDYAAQWSEVYLMRGQEVCGGDFEAEISRSAFGVTHSLPFVADRVRLLVQVEAVRDP